MIKATVIDALKSMIKSSGKHQYEVSAEMGYKTPSGLGNVLNMRKSPVTDTVVKLADILGYDVILVPREITPNTPEAIQIMTSSDAADLQKRLAAVASDSASL